MLTPQRIMLANGAMFLFVLGTAVWVMTAEPVVPGEPPVRELRQTVNELLDTPEEQAALTADRFTNLGQRRLFDTVIPRPTPTPPPPTPTPADPDITEITRDWRLSGAMRTMGIFQHMRTKEDFVLRVGERRVENFRGQDIEVELLETESMRWVRLRIVINGREQVRQIRMTL